MNSYAMWCDVVDCRVRRIYTQFVHTRWPFILSMFFFGLLVMFFNVCAHIKIHKAKKKKKNEEVEKTKKKMKKIMFQREATIWFLRVCISCQCVSSHDAHARVMHSISFSVATTEKEKKNTTNNNNNNNGSTLKMDLWPSAGRSKKKIISR